jgi:D-alanyl-lipoteichoic acid acyltransferase DltB (MBOAT superfamily)
MTVTGATDLVFLGWLLGVVVAAGAAPTRFRGDVIAAVTALFLALADPRSLGVLIALALVVIGATRRPGPRGGPWRLGGIAIVLVVLFAFKAFDPVRGLASGGVIVPLGLSFYTLRCIHVLVECHLEEIAPPSPRQLLGYLFFLPTIVAGPVHRYPPFVAHDPQPLAWPRVSSALERMLYGYAKIVVVSNYLLSTKLFPYLKAQVDPSGALYQYLDCLDFGLNLYFQFSGYSDIAITAALLLGWTVMENFDWPLLRTNLVDFWRTWHISVTSWCREYVFTGVYAGTRQRWLAMLTTMLAIGLWHGLSLNFVAWGLYHGIGLVATQWWTATVLKRRRLEGPAGWLLAAAGWLITFNYVTVGFAWTKEPDLASSIHVLRLLLSGGHA